MLDDQWSLYNFCWTDHMTVLYRTRWKESGANVIKTCLERNKNKCGKYWQHDPNMCWSFSKFGIMQENMIKSRSCYECRSLPWPTKAHQRSAAQEEEHVKQRITSHNCKCIPCTWANRRQQSLLPQSFYQHRSARDPLSHPVRSGSRIKKEDPQSDEDYEVLLQVVSWYWYLYLNNYFWGQPISNWWGESEIIEDLRTR